GEVVRAGTPVKITEIVYPTDSLKAALGGGDGGALAPTAHTWVVVERTDAGADGTKLVLVLPRDIRSKEAFKGAMQERLVSSTWVTAWLTQRDPEMLDHIYRKEVVEGMAYAEVVAALGRPKNHTAYGRPGTLEFTADYGDQQVTLKGKLVAKVISRKMEAEKARKIAEEEAEKARTAADERRKVEEEKRRIEAETRLAEEAEKKAEEERLRAELAAQAEAERKAAAETAAKDRELARIQAQQERKRDEAERIAEARRREKEDRKRVRLAELEARKEAARRGKEAVRAEAEALKAQKRAKRDGARADAEATAERRKLVEETKRFEAEAVAARKRAEKAARAEARVRDLRAPERKVAMAAPAPTRSATPPPLVTGGRGKVGVSVKTLTAKKARSLEVLGGKGALVNVVKWDGAGKKAGMKRGDVILELDGMRVDSAREFALLASQLEAGRTISIAIWRHEERMVLAVTPIDVEAEKARQEVEKRAREQAVRAAEAERQAQMQAEARELMASKRAEAADGKRLRATQAEETRRQAKIAPARREAEEAARQVEAKAVAARSRTRSISKVNAKPLPPGKKGKVGVSVKNLTAADAKNLRLESLTGALVSRVSDGGAGADAGLEANDVIVSVDGMSIKSAKEFALVASQTEAGTTIAVVVLRNGKRMSFAVIPKVPGSTTVSRPPPRFGKTVAHDDDTPVGRPPPRPSRRPVDRRKADDPSLDQEFAPEN
ncbi:MAG: PDZ domain-containing protein, partial [Myxococcota bacterium]